ncbi:MAG: hypothetical protein ACJAXX_000301 [Roseivirga sp.]|jgi:hypothetical protein
MPETDNNTVVAPSILVDTLKFVNTGTIDDAA